MKRIVIASVAVVLGAAVGWACGTEQHRSVALLEVVPPTPKVLFSAQAGQTSASPPMLEAFVAGQAARIRSRRFIDLAVSDPRWNGDPDPGAFAQRLATRPLHRGPLVEVAFEHRDAEVAQRAVELLVQHFLRIDADSEASGDARNRALAAEQERLEAALAAQSEGTAQAADLGAEAAQTRRQLELVRMRRKQLELEAPPGSEPSVRTVAAPQPATEGGSDNRPALAGLGGLIALVLGGGGALTLRR